MSNAAIVNGLAGVVISDIQEHYFKGRMKTTLDCKDDMLRDGLYEADVEKVITEAAMLEKVMAANSPNANPLNTHYVIYGESTKGKKVYCKICTIYHPQTNKFIGWKLTSFCLRR
jgi:hypothetical protein